MKSILKFSCKLGLILGLAALSSAVMAKDAAAASYSGAYCREFTKTVTIGRKQTEAWGTACMQPDGSWQIVDTNSEAVYDNPQTYIVLRDPVPPPPRYRTVTYYNTPPVLTTRYVYVKQPASYNRNYRSYDRGWDNGRYNERYNRGWNNNRRR